MKKNKAVVSADGRFIKKSIISPAYIWTAAAIWILAGLFLPLYKISFILITAVVSFLTAGLIKLLLPKKEQTVEVPFLSGDEKLDSAVALIDGALKTLTAYADELSANRPATSGTLNETCATLTFIRAEIIKDSANMKKLRRLFDYYLPTEMKITQKYLEMSNTEKNGEYSMSTFTAAEEAIIKLNTAFKKQYDSLFEDDALDAETDIAVLDTMLEQDNLK